MRNLLLMLLLLTTMYGCYPEVNDAILDLLTKGEHTKEKEEAALRRAGVYKETTTYFNANGRDEKYLKQATGMWYPYVQNKTATWLKDPDSEHKKKKKKKRKKKKKQIKPGDGKNFKKKKGVNNGKLHR